MKTQQQDSPSSLKGCPDYNRDGVVEKGNIKLFAGRQIKTRYTKNIPYNPQMKQRARDLRQAGILSEVIFWKKVRNKGFWELDFDRQKVIGSYIVDFYVKSLSLIIEIDGSSHWENEEYDNHREKFLSSLNLTIYRIKDSRIKEEFDAVLKELEMFIIEEYGI